MFGPEPPARYEWWLYPTLIVLVGVWKFYPLTFYWQNLWNLETLLFTLAGGLEVWQFRQKRPWIALIILMAVSGGLSFALFNQGASAKLFYWVMIGLFAYIWFLNKMPEFFGWLFRRLTKRK
jgi:hypothetical protein